MKIFQKIQHLSLLFLVLSAASVSASPITLKVMVTSITPAGGVSLTPVWVGFHDGSFDSYTNPNKFVFKFSSSPPSPAGEGIYENLLGLVL